MANEYLVTTDWRWYKNDAAEPSTALAAENTSAALRGYNTIRGRLAVSEPPNSAYMWGWYKMNEQTGTTLYNTASASVVTKLPDLTICSGDPWGGSYFWSYPVSANTVQASASMNTVSVSGVGTFGIFIMTQDWPGGFTARTVSCLSGNGAQVGLVNGYYIGPTQQNFAARGDGISYSYQYAASSLTLNKWCFVFSTNEFDPGPGVKGTLDIHIIFDDGTKVDGNTGLGSYGYATYDYNNLSIGMEYYGGSWIDWNGLLGDLIMYYPDAEMLVDDWATWYDRLRGNYGMAARSGW